MRIAIINWSRRKIGGVETYLSGIIPDLHRLNFTLAFWSEVDSPKNREQIELPDQIPAWCIADLGLEKSLAALRDWKPDLLYIHKVDKPEIEARLLEIAPSAFFAHDYYGTCISGLKTNKYPTMTPCHRRFGWPCLLHYYPHRCGGWSPVTMLKLYRLQSKRLENLHKYNAIITHSEYLQAEYIQHGISADSVHNLSYYAHQSSNSLNHFDESQAKIDSLVDSSLLHANIPATDRLKPSYQLLFVGRMDLLKGGNILLKALPQVSSALNSPLKMIFAGDGPERDNWQRQATRIKSRNSDLSIEFVGWMDRPQLERLCSKSDLLVVPSLWPEPFGLVGIEAGSKYLPAAAFNVGGIPTWLIDGVNGYLASGNPPSPTGIAGAIIKCLENPLTYARLRQGAFKIAQQFNIHNHVSALLNIFERILAEN